MARPGDVIENPLSGERFVFRQTARETNGELLQFDLFLRPGGSVPVEHVHGRQEERFEIVNGSVGFRVAGREQIAEVGQVLTVAPGTGHVLWNSGDGEAHVAIGFRPALNTETMFETICGLARDGKSNKRGMPGPLQTIVLAREYQVFLPRLPIVAQRPAVALLAPLARLLGYRAHYPQYSGPD